MIQQIHHQQQFELLKNMVVRQSKFLLNMNLLFIRLHKKHPKL